MRLVNTDISAPFCQKSLFAKWSGLGEEECFLLKTSIGGFRAIWLWSLVSARRRVKNLLMAIGLNSRGEAKTFDDSPPDKNKRGTRVLFAPSDNNESSGAFRSMVALARILRDRHGFDPFVVLPCEGTGTALLRDASIPYIHVPSFDWIIPLKTDRRSLRFAINVVRKIRTNHLAVSTIASLIERYDVDLIHVNTTWGYVGALAAKRASKPCIWHVREFLEEDQEATIWSRDAGNRLISNADAVVAISRSVAAKYASLVPPQRLQQIYNGVDESPFLAPERTILERPPFTFVMVGGFQRYKGHVEFSKACVSLHSKGIRDFRVWFVGKGNDDVKDECAKIFSDANMDSAVTFFGHQKDPAEFLKQADIAFTCSRFEAFGRVTVEAMMAGCLVVGSKKGGTPELIEDGKTGLLFDPGSNAVDHIVEKAQWALENPERARTIAAAGTKRAMERFTASRNADEIARLYRKILSERKAL